jgi:hypothetical protein
MIMRFVEEENQIVDTLTGLIWQSSYKPDLTFDEALEYAEIVSKETGLEWRVPTIEELSSLIDRSRANPASAFPDMSSDWFWSSSPFVVNSDNTWIVHFKYGNVFYGNRHYNYAVRLVRSR